MENLKLALFIGMIMMVSCTSITMVSESDHRLHRKALNLQPQNSNPFSNSKDLPYDGPAAVSGNVGAGSSCLISNTAFIASAPPDVWNNGAACGTSIQVTCFPLRGSFCTTTPTISVQIVDLSCTDCGDLYYFSHDAFDYIAAADATEIGITLSPMITGK